MTCVQELGAIRIGGMILQLNQIIVDQLKLESKLRFSVHDQTIEGKKDTVNWSSEPSSKV